MLLKNVSESSFVVFLKKPQFLIKSVLQGEEFAVDDRTGYAILAEYPEHIKKIEKVEEVKAKAFAKSPSDKSLEVKL